MSLGRIKAHLGRGLAALVFSVGVVCAAPPAPFEAASPVDFTPSELRLILQHGPWPPPAARDAGNAMSANPKAQALGQQLFFDPRLSGDGSLSCGSCHAPEKAFSDGRARSVGKRLLDRNASSLWNGVHERWHGWDGAADSLWSQAIRPLLDRREMASSEDHIARVIANDKALTCRYQKVFGAAPLADSQATLVNVAKALGAFTSTLVSGPTPFDNLRDALAQGDWRQARRYPVSAQRGLKLFVGRGQCHLCHVGPLFSNGEFGDIGIPFFVRPGEVDPGRYGGIIALRASQYNLLSKWNDDPSGIDAVKTRHVDAQHRNFGEFKVPSLRNVADTGPYMHAGQLATLQAVLKHYGELNLDRLHADGEQILKPLALSAEEAHDLLAFLRTLSDPNANAWKPQPLLPCKKNKKITPDPGGRHRATQQATHAGKKIDANQ